MQHCWKKLNRRSQHLLKAVSVCNIIQWAGCFFEMDGSMVEGSTEHKSVSVNGLRHVCLVLCAIVRYLAIYLSQFHFLPSTGTKVEWDWKYNPRRSLTKATIEPLKAPGPLQAKHQFSLSVHEAIWLGNKPISTSFLFNSQQKIQSEKPHLPSTWFWDRNGTYVMILHTVVPSITSRSQFKKLEIAGETS